MNTQTKTIFFVRHGESRSNATGIREGMDSPLTELGVKQCTRIAKRLRDHHIERIVSSDFTRALHLAEIVSSELTLPISHVSSLFGERRNPSILLGTRENDTDARLVWNEIKAHYGEANWRYSDEENFDDFRLRIMSALDFLLTLPERRIVVASHGMTMKMILAHVTLGTHLTGEIFWKQFVPIKNVRNTGLMVLEYTPNYDRTSMFWKLVSWNDHAHLEGL